MPQKWQAIGNTVSDLTGPRFEPQTSRSRGERVTAQPTGIVVNNFLLTTGIIFKELIFDTSGTQHKKTKQHELLKQTISLIFVACFGVVNFNFLLTLTFTFFYFSPLLVQKKNSVNCKIKQFAFRT